MNIKTGAAALTLIAIFTLASCASPDTPDAGTGPVIDQQQEQNTEPAVGDTVGVPTARALNDAKGDLRAYELSDGRWEVVEAGAPLTDEIRADIEAKLAAIPGLSGPDDDIERPIDNLTYSLFDAGLPPVAVVFQKNWPHDEPRWIHLSSNQPFFGNWLDGTGGDGQGTAEEYAAELSSDLPTEPFEIFIHN